MCVLNHFMNNAGRGHGRALVRLQARAQSLGRGGWVLGRVMAEGQIILFQ